MPRSVPPKPTPLTIFNGTLLVSSLPSMILFCAPQGWDNIFSYQNPPTTPMVPLPITLPQILNHGRFVVTSFTLRAPPVYLLNPRCFSIHNTSFLYSSSHSIRNCQNLMAIMYHREFSVLKKLTDTIC